MNIQKPQKKHFIITGHYGSGKTNLACNLALLLSSEGRKVTLIDFDIVNPYFRAADARARMEESGVRCIIPEYANSNVDVPSLPAEVNFVFDSSKNIDNSVFDVGGDADGATALAVYADRIAEQGYEMYCVCNMYRPLTADPGEAVGIIREIESKSRLKMTALINNSNLGAETTPDTVSASLEWADEISLLSGLPVAALTVMDTVGYNGVHTEIKQMTKQLF